MPRITAAELARDPALFGRYFGGRQPVVVTGFAGSRLRASLMGTLQQHGDMAVQTSQFAGSSKVGTPATALCLSLPFCFRVFVPLMYRLLWHCCWLLAPTAHIGCCCTQCWCYIAGCCCCVAGCCSCVAGCCVAGCCSCVVHSAALMPNLLCCSWASTPSQPTAAAPFAASSVTHLEIRLNRGT